jgi:hypothetical protein
MTPPVPQPTRRLRHLLGWLISGLCVALALGRALTAQMPPPPRRLSEAERAELGRLCATQEPSWRRRTVARFPGDRWSQDDDFHSVERFWALGEAARRGVPVSDVFRAVDEDLRSHPVEPPRKSNASPCKPRPFYD